MDDMVRRMPTIQTSYPGVSEEDRQLLLSYLDAVGIEAYTTLWRQVIDAILVHARKGEWIAWPPSFALQDRDPEYVKLKFEAAEKRYKK